MTDNRAGSNGGPSTTSAEQGSVEHLDDDEKHYLASWYKQTNERMEYPKAKAVIAAQRFKNFLGRKKEEPKPEEEHQPTPPPPRTPTPVQKTPTPPPPRTPTPREPTPPPREPTPPPPEPKSKPKVVKVPKKPKEVADPRDNLIYIQPAPPPWPWRKATPENSEAVRLAKLEKWQVDFATRFLEASWGDPYFARSVMLDMNKQVRSRQEDIERNRRQILEMRRDHHIMRDYVRELEQRNHGLKSNYIRQIPFEGDALPPVPLESLDYEERRQVEKRLQLVDRIKFLREKQFVDTEVLRDYSRRLGGHLSRADMEAVRYFVPTSSRFENPQMDAVYEDLKEKYFMLKDTVDRQTIELNKLESKLKRNDLIGQKQLDKIADAHDRDTILFNTKMRKFMQLRDEDPVLNYYQNYRSLMEEPRLEATREARFTENYRRSKLKNRIDQLDKEISEYRKSHILNR